MSLKKKLFPGLVLAMTAVSSLQAFAAESSGGSTGSPASGSSAQTGGTMPIWIWIIIYGAMFALFYFLLIRPNKKKQKAEAALRDNVVLGDEITTIGGIVGKVVNIKDDEITIESSLDRTLMQFKKWAIRDVKKLESDTTEEKK